MTQTLAQRIVERVAGRSGPDRRGFLRGTTLGAAALATTPWSFLTRPASAYDAVCGSHNTCASGYTVFCCTINGGANSCPPNSFVAGWWKADNASLCNGAARYYIDCNAYRDNAWQCRCNSGGGTCDNRLVACNQFRYGQCNTQIPWSNTGPVVCRVVSCTPPWQEYAGVCSSASRTDNNTTTHSAPCLPGPGETSPPPPNQIGDDDMRPFLIVDGANQQYAIYVPATNRFVAASYGEINLLVVKFGIPVQRISPAERAAILSIGAR